MIEAKILQGDAIDVLKTLPDESVNMCVTSPPYYALRDYGTGKWVGGDNNCPHRRLSQFSEKITTGHKQKELIGMVGDGIYKSVCPLCGAVRVDQQIGLEETPEEYIQKLVNVFREVKRVLKDDGTLWVNIGDSYFGSGSRGSNNTKYYEDSGTKQGTNKGSVDLQNIPKLVGNHNGIKNKDLIGIPWMLAFALRADGWYLRQDIIWHKPNPMPESVKDRCTKSHEYIFLFSKNKKYYFDHESIKEKANGKYEGRYNYEFNAGEKETSGSQRPNGKSNTKGKRRYTGERNKRDVWQVSVSGYEGAHFATFPEKLVEPCILAGSPKMGGVVLDCFNGAGTTGVVSIKNGRSYIGIELNQDFIEMSHKRIEKIKKEIEESKLQQTIEGF